MKIEKPIRLIELFAGYGSQAMAFERMGVSFESHAISEWEVGANASYKAVHNRDANTNYADGMNKEELVEALIKLCISSDGKTPMTRSQISKKNLTWLQETYNCFRNNKNLGSICGIHGNDLQITDTDKYEYIMFYSFPCQDLSVAGKQKGMSRGSGTRSGLLWEVERLLKELNRNGEERLPQILIMENVTQVHGSKALEDFNEWITFLNSLGYKSFWQDMNALDYGVAQSRNRCIMVSILKSEFANTSYEFPKKIPLTSAINNYLESNVPEEYYNTTKKAEELILDLLNREGLLDNNTAVDASIFEPKQKKVANCICARNDRGISNHKSEGTAVLAKNVVYDDYNHNLPAKQNTIGTVTQTCGHTALGNGKKIIEARAVAMRGRYVDSHTVRMVGRNPDNPTSRISGLPTEQRLEVQKEPISNAITTVQKDSMIIEYEQDVVSKSCNSFQIIDCSNGQVVVEYQNATTGQICTCVYSLRKLTERECGRLMGVSEEDITRMQQVCSKSSLYKQFGNSIVVDVLIAIFSQLGITGIIPWNQAR